MDKLMKEALELVSARRRAARLEASAKGGRKGGRSTSAAKKAAARANLIKANRARFNKIGGR